MFSFSIFIYIFTPFSDYAAYSKEKKIARKKEEEEAPTTKKCPFCCSEISIKATKCPHCTSEVPLEVEEEKK